MLGAVGKFLLQKMKPILADYIGSDRWNTGLRFEVEDAFLFSSEIVGQRDEHLKSFYFHEERGNALFWEGEIYNWEELQRKNGNRRGAELLWQLYQRSGRDFLEWLNGGFSLALWNEDEKSLLLVRDRIGLREVYYGLRDQGIVFGSSLRVLAQLLQKSSDVNLSALLKYLTFCYNPGTQTFHPDLHRLRPGHFLEWQEGNETVRRYWRLTFDSDVKASEEVLAAEIRDRLASAVRIRIEGGEKIGVFLSGGLDSSSVVSLLKQEGKNDLFTFSYRCKGESVDESRYAQIVADTFGTKHRVVEYSPEDILLAQGMVALMDEPFCDVGINVATYLLAREAGGEVELLFTGDGGDELFAGHPVYVADRLGRFLDRIPQPLLKPFISWGRLLHDSERKKDWKVKIKRFSESYAFPWTLGTHRWRVYYHPRELVELVVPEIWDDGKISGFYDDIIQYNKEIDNADALSRSLYCDYQTVVQFYLRRMEMTREFGLRPMFPLLDPDVVVFCATIPPSLKIRGFSETKYIEKVAVEPLLPREVVHRKDKLGHSIPLKNWMRDNTKVKAFVFDLLSEETIHRRGLFRSDVVNRMVQEHLNKTRNHSHRLWSLAVLELWLRHHDNLSLTNSGRKIV